MSQADYRNAVKTGASIDWRCLTCDFPQAESTALSENLSEISASANPDADFDSEETTRGWHNGLNRRAKGRSKKYSSSDCTVDFKRD